MDNLDYEDQEDTKPGGSDYPPQSQAHLESMVERLRRWWEGRGARVEVRGKKKEEEGEGDPG